MTNVKNAQGYQHFLTVYAKSLLEQSSLIRMLKKTEIDYIMSKAILSYHSNGQTLIEENSPIEYLYILIEGALKVLDDGKIVLDRPGPWNELWIGEDASEKKVAEDTVIFAMDSVIMKVPIRFINEKIGTVAKRVDVSNQG